MKLTANITLDELCKSQVSERKGINNNPNPAQIENLKALAPSSLYFSFNKIFKSVS